VKHLISKAYTESEHPNSLQLGKLHLGLRYVLDGKDGAENQRTVGARHADLAKSNAFQWDLQQKQGLR
jgi:hypothetical protein